MLVHIVASNWGDETSQSDVSDISIWSTREKEIHFAWQKLGVVIKERTWDLHESYESFDWDTPTTSPLPIIIEAFFFCFLVALD